MGLGPLCWIGLYSVGMPARYSPLSFELVVLVIVLYPLLEEIVFRGALQGMLLNHPWPRHSLAGVSIACLITSLAFAAMHLVRQPPLWAVLVFFPSLVFGWSRDRHGTLLPPILLHMSYNAGFIALFETG